MPVRLSDSSVRALRPGSEVRDAITPGLVVRVQRRDPVFTYVYKRDGKVTRVTLGKYPSLTLADARDRARKLAAAVDGTATSTVASLLDAYGDHLRKTAKDPGQVVALLDRHVRPAIGDRKLIAVTRRDVQGLIDRAEAAPSTRGRIAVLLRAAWRFGIRRGFVENDVTALLDKPGQSKGPRQRVLTDDELSSLVTQWRAGSSPFDRIFELLLLTGCRRSEIAEMRWNELRGDEIHLPAARTKSSRAHVVPLSPQALAVLAKVPRIEGEPLCFPADGTRRPLTATGSITRPGRSGRGAVSGFTTAIRRAVVKGWTPHDLRRTCASGLARLGVRPEVIERVLNHSAPILQRTYQVHDYLPEMRAALALWADHVATLSKTD